MRNILILADLSSPLMLNRIKMLKDLPYKKYILHNANNVKLNDSVRSDYEGFVVLEQPRIQNATLRYGCSFLITLFWLCVLSPRLIVVHWASRLYQNILLALWGKRVIVHTMGGDIDKMQDYKERKKFFVSLLLRHAKVISVKSHYMIKMICENDLSINPAKIVCISWGVEDRFRQSITKEQQQTLQRKLLGKEFDFLFFSIRAFNSFYRQKEIIESFLQHFRGKKKIGLMISGARIDQNYKNSIQGLEEENILICDICHKEMDQYILMSDCVVSYSLSDGLSQSLMESVGLKRWILTNHLPNHHELLQDGMNAICVHDEVELQEGFLKMLDFCRQDYPKETSKDTLNIHTQQERYLKVLSSFLDD